MTRAERRRHRAVRHLHLGTNSTRMRSPHPSHFAWVGSLTMMGTGYDLPPDASFRVTISRSPRSEPSVSPSSGGGLDGNGRMLDAA